MPVGSFTSLVHRLSRIGNVATEITIADVDEDVRGELGVLGADTGRTLRQLDVSDLAERHRAAVRQRHQNVLGDRLRIRAQIARIADRDGVAFTAFHRGCDGFGAKRHRHHVLHVGDHQTVARQLVTIGEDFEVVAANNTLGIGAGGARDRFEDSFDLAGNLSPSPQGPYRSP